MLKALFRNRLFIGALAFFVLIVVSGTLYLRHNERQGQIELERSQERIQQWEARQKQTPKAPIAPSEKVPEGETPQGGHIHADGTFHAEPHDAVETNHVTGGDPFANTIPIHDSATMRRLEIEKRNAFYKERFGLGPPPEGYGYLLIDGNEVVLNPDGTPVLQQMELPDGTRMEYEIELREGFAPTREVWKRYQQLKQNYEVARHREDRAEAARIQAEIRQIEETARGLKPFVSSNGMIPTHLITPAYEAKLSKMGDELENKTLIHMGMEYLIRPEGPEIYYVGPR